MKRVLLTGMSGTGKSSVLAELRARGFKTVDTDDGGWTEQVEVAANAGSAPAMEWLWREDLMARLLSTEDADVLFVSGAARNQTKFYPRFDHIVLLTAPVPVMIERLTRRTNNRMEGIPPSWPKSSASSRPSSPRCGEPRISRSTPASRSTRSSRRSSTACSDRRPNGTGRSRAGTYARHRQALARTSLRCARSIFGRRTSTAG